MSNSTSNSTAGYAPFDLYPYNPAQGPGYAFLALFGLAAITHLAMMIPYRAFFPFPMVLGCCLEATGYYFRAQSHDNMRQTLPYIIQYLAVFAAPPLLAAMIYMSPGRILRAVKADDLSLISPRWQTKLFVLVDVGCFATQFAGVIMSGSEDVNQASTGKTVLLSGLVTQVCAFGVFLLCLVVAHARLNNMPSMILESPGFHWKRYFGGLYFVSVMFLIRNAVRIVEQNQGSNGTIASSEAYLYAFDAAFMLIVAVTMFLLHPGRLIQKARRITKATHFESGLALE